MLLDMTPTSTATFLADLIKKTLDQVPTMGASILRPILAALWISFQPYLPYAIGGLFIVLIVVSIMALYGETGALGSLLYHLLYFGIFGIIVWIRGLEILFSDYFDLICVVLYPICYWLTGLILKKFKDS
jgi:hypothetical protein